MRYFHFVLETEAGEKRNFFTCEDNFKDAYRAARKRAKAINAQIVSFENITDNLS